MATFNKFNCFVEDVAEKKHNLGSDIFKVLLTNTAPNAGDTYIDTTGGVCIIQAVSAAQEIAAGNGYTKGGNSAAIASSAQSGGLYKLVLDDPATWTATPAAMPTFRYAVLYNETSGTSAARLPVGWHDYGVGGVTLGIGETFKADMDPTTGVLTLQ